jgi:predicted short-subunit dehydrogenase-like oxidoreductase (DUF2520 family)
MSTTVQTIGIVGAGRVGAVLGAALARAGHRIAAVSGRSPASRERAATLLPGSPRHSASQVASGAGLVILAVPDDVLAPLVAHLAESGVFHKGQTLVHTSGAHGVAILHPAVALGVRPLAMHPAMTFTGTAADLDRLPGATFGVTAPPDVRPLAARLVADLGGVPEWIDEHQRAMYHTALAHGANHLVTLVNEAHDRLRDAGVTRPERMLRPLLEAALNNALALGDAALTGPVSRGDAGTVARHLATLDTGAPESTSVYLALARRTADRVIAAGRLSPHSAAPLLEVLAPSQDPARAGRREPPSVLASHPTRADQERSPGRVAA